MEDHHHGLRSIRFRRYSTRNGHRSLLLMAALLCPGKVPFHGKFPCPGRARCLGKAPSPGKAYLALEKRAIPRLHLYHEPRIVKQVVLVPVHLCGICCRESIMIVEP